MRVIDQCFDQLSHCYKYIQTIESGCGKRGVLLADNITNKAYLKLNKPLQDCYQHRLQARIHFADRLEYVSPALIAQSIFSGAAASDMGQMFAYDKSIYDHFAIWRDYLDALTFRHNDRITRKEFHGLPQGGFWLVIDKQTLWLRLVALLMGSAFLFIIAFIRLNKNIPTSLIDSIC